MAKITVYTVDGRLGRHLWGTIVVEERGQVTVDDPALQTAWEGLLARVGGDLSQAVELAQAYFSQSRTVAVVEPEPES
jgi:hypothetical protein